MSVVVYSRLGDLLRSSNLTVEQLRGLIAARTGLQVDMRSLMGLAGDGRVARPDVEIAGAAAAALDVPLDDLFDVRVSPESEDSRGWHATGEGSGMKGIDALLDPEWRGRLEAILATVDGDEEALKPAERAEVDRLRTAIAGAVVNGGLHDIADRRGVPVERVRAEIMVAAAQSSARWKSLQADPALMAVAVREAKTRRQVAGPPTG